ncbi:MAG TPA: tetratricopeptide repeat protein [Syntrophales bacterium]|nr:tetratricopeptide repeat protein [Syntrophales bacterium]
MDKRQRRRKVHLFFACIIIAPILICGCSHLYEGFLARPDFKEANDLLNQGNYKDSLSKYEQIIARYPTAGDKVLFEMGFIYAFPRNQQKDYQKSLECFQKLIKSYPASEYRQDSEVMISLINEVTRKTSFISEVSRKTPPVNDVTSKDKRIISQRKQIEALEQQVKELEKKIEQMKEVDMNLKEKKKSFLEKQ